MIVGIRHGDGPFNDFAGREQPLFAETPGD
jgi:hypothetical protein